MRFSVTPVSSASAVLRSRYMLAGICLICPLCPKQFSFNAVLVKLDSPQVCSEVVKQSHSFGDICFVYCVRRATRHAVNLTWQVGHIERKRGQNQTPKVPLHRVDDVGIRILFVAPNVSTQSVRGRNVERCSRARTCRTVLCKCVCPMQIPLTFTL